MGTPANQVGPSLEQKVDRLMIAVALLATVVDEDHEENHVRQSLEERIEMVLYPEHFLGTTRL